MAGDKRTDGDRPAATTRVLDEAELAELVGVDDSELAEFGQGIVDQVAAARAKAAGTGEGEKPPEAEGAESEPATEPEGAAGPSGHERERAIPRKRFDEVNERRRVAEEVATRLQEELARLKAERGRGSDPPDPAAEPETPPDADPRRAGIEGQLDALADRYDAGDIDRKEYDRQRRPLERDLYRIELEADWLLGQPQLDPAALAAEVRYQDEAERLDAENPWLQGLRPGEFQVLLEEAEGRFRERYGRDPADPREAHQARLLAVEAARELGYVDLGNARLAKAGKSPATPASQPSQDPSTGKPTADQRRAKLDLAKQQPPDLSKAPVPGKNFDVSLEDIDKMSAAEIASLPESVKKRLAAESGLPV